MRFFMILLALLSLIVFGRGHALAQRPEKDKGKPEVYTAYYVPMELDAEGITPYNITHPRLPTAIVILPTGRYEEFLAALKGTKQPGTFHPFSITLRVDDEQGNPVLFLDKSGGVRLGDDEEFQVSAGGLIRIYLLMEYILATVPNADTERLATPPQGYVPDAKTAAQIAKIAWRARYKNRFPIIPGSVTVERGQERWQVEADSSTPGGYHLICHRGKAFRHHL